MKTLLHILLTILVMFIVEYLFHVPSSILHDSNEPFINLYTSQESSDSSSSADSNVIYCNSEYLPVCGADSITYPNACEATRSRTSVAYTGTCDGRDISLPLVRTEATSSSSTGANSTDVASVIDTNTGTSDALTFDTGSYHIYENTALKYGFALPKFTYYQGYAARDGAAHTMAVALTASGILAFENADVRIWFYKSPPADLEGRTSITLPNGVILVEGDVTVPRIATIIDTVKRSARVTE